MAHRILINGTVLLGPHTGIGQYVRALFSAMAADPALDLRVYNGWRFNEGFALPSPGAALAARSLYGAVRRLVPRPRSLRRMLEGPMFSLQARRFSPSALYHEPGFAAFPYDGPMVMSVYDLSCFDHPELHPAERVALVERHMPASIARADHILAISHATANALQHRFNVGPDRITVTHLAADARFRPLPSSALDAPLAHFGLRPGGYVLSVGTLEPRKNLATLFAAYEALPQVLRQTFPLVVAGITGWHEAEIFRSAQTLLRRGELRLLGFVPDDSMPPLYAGAAAFCYPSRYEGFGLPPLEAMACGVPVITSNRTSLPEVVGDAGLMVDPDDVDGLRLSLERLLEDGALARDLAARGMQRAAGFSWQRCAQETAAVYRRVLDAHRRTGG